MHHGRYSKFQLLDVAVIELSCPEISCHLETLRHGNNRSSDATDKKRIHTDIDMGSYAGASCHFRIWLQIWILFFYSYARKTFFKIITNLQAIFSFYFLAIDSSLIPIDRVHTAPGHTFLSGSEGHCLPAMAFNLFIMWKENETYKLLIFMITNGLILGLSAGFLLWLTTAD